MVKNRIQLLIPLGLIVCHICLIWASYRHGDNPLDLAIYMSAAKALLSGGNPWDPETLNATAKANLYGPGSFIIWGLWSPPTSMILVAPLLVFNFQTAAYVWYLLNLLVLVTCCWIISQNLKDIKFWEIISVGILLPPFWFLALWGQVSGLVLFGLLAFLYYANKRKDLMAGASLSLTLLKPHLCFLTIIFIFFWAWRESRLKVIGGFFGITALVLAIITMVNSNWIKFYQNIWKTPPFEYDATIPIRQIMAPLLERHPELQFIGIGISTLILCLILLRLKKIKLSLESLGVLTLLSLFFTAYGWVYDQIVLLPTLIWLLANWKIRFGNLAAYVLVAILFGIYHALIFHSAGGNDSRPMWFVLIMTLMVLWQIYNNKKAARVAP